MATEKDFRVKSSLIAPTSLQVGSATITSNGSAVVLPANSVISDGLGGTTALGSVDLTGYATETYVNNAVAAIDLTGYATETYVNNTVANYLTISSFNTQISSYALTTDVNNALALKANTSSLAAVATSGNYNDLSNTPTIPSLTGYATETYVDNGLALKADTSSLSTVATSGSYNDLSNLPTLFSGSYTDLTNKPTLFSGSYNDLSDLPSLFSGSYNDLSNLPTLFSGSYTDLTDKPTLFSGSYIDLTNKPTLYTDSDTGAYLTANGYATQLWVTSQNYLTAESDTLDAVTSRGNTTANSITVGDFTATGNVQIDGNLTISGTTATVSASNLAVTDNMIYMNQGVEATVTNAVGSGTEVVYTADNNYSIGMSVTVTGITPSSLNAYNETITAADATSFTIASVVTDTYVSGGTARAKTNSNPDLGFAAGYNDGTYAHAGIFRDASDGKWKFFDSYTPEPDASAFIDTAHASFNLAPIEAGSIYSNGNLVATQSYVDNTPGGIEYVVKTSNYTASANEGIITDTSSGAFTVTLPASPSVGDQVIIADGNDWSNNNLTIGRNGSTIKNTAEDLVCDIQGVSIQLIYDGSTWEVYALAAGSSDTSNFLTGNETITLSGDITGSGTTSINAQLAANVVSANELNVSGNGTTSQYLRSDGDGTFTWATPPDTTANQTITLSGDLSGSGTTSIDAQLAANVVSANELNVSGNGTTSQYLRSDGDGSFTWATPPDTTANQTITLSGDVSGSGTTSISVTVADDSHNHIISNVDGLQDALDALASPSFTDDITVNGLTVGKGANAVTTNTAFGIDALDNTEAAFGGIANNTAIGYLALRSNTSGVNNTVVGSGNLYNNTSGSSNTAIGRQVLYTNTTGSTNVAIGLSTMFYNTTGAGNIAIGYRAGFNNTTGNYNTAIGWEALNDNNGGANLAIGFRAGYKITTGANNIALGTEAMYNHTTGDQNIAIGEESLWTHTTGFFNVAIGYLALYSSSTSSSNTAVGYRALNLTTASNNTALGREAGDTLTTGTNNTLIGYNAQPSSATVSNEITLGNANVTSLRVPALNFSINNSVVSAKSYKETVYAISGTTPAIAASNGNIQTWTLSGNSTPTDSLAAGESVTLMIDDGSAYTITWTSLSVDWKTDGGSAPTLNTTDFTTIVLWKVGTTIYGARVGDA